MTPPSALLTLVAGIVLAGGLSSVQPASGSTSLFGALAAPHAFDKLGSPVGGIHPQRAASIPNPQEPPPPVSGGPVERVVSSTVVSGEERIAGDGPPRASNSFPDANIRYLTSLTFEPGVYQAIVTVYYRDGQGLAGVFFDNGPIPGSTSVSQDFNYERMLLTRINDATITQAQRGVVISERSADSPISAGYLAPAGQMQAAFDVNATSYSMTLSTVVRPVGMSDLPIQDSISGGLLDDRRTMRMGIWSRTDGQIVVTRADFTQTFR